MTNCKMPSVACRLRLDRRVKPSLPARLTLIAVALAALLVMSYGERWVLNDTAAAMNELTVATCVLDAVYGDASAPDVCSARSENGKGNAL